MNQLTKAVNDYLALRRSLGFKLREYGKCLREFAAFLKKNGSLHITTKLALEYATQRQYRSQFHGRAGSSSSVVLLVTAQATIRRLKSPRSAC